MAENEKTSVKYLYPNLTIDDLWRNSGGAANLIMKLALAQRMTNTNPFWNEDVAEWKKKADILVQNPEEFKTNILPMLIKENVPNEPYNPGELKEESYNRALQFNLQEINKALADKLGRKKVESALINPAKTAK